MMSNDKEKEKKTNCTAQLLILDTEKLLMLATAPDFTFFKTIHTNMNACEKRRWGDKVLKEGGSGGRRRAPEE